MYCKKFSIHKNKIDYHKLPVFNLDLCTRFYLPNYLEQKGLVGPLFVHLVCFKIVACLVL